MSTGIGYGKHFFSHTCNTNSGAIYIYGNRFALD
jgi:hypothetical protein